MTRNIRYISDTHFGHKNIIKYCDRPFTSVEEMDIFMLTKLREAEADGAAIWHLGDVAMDLERTIQTYGWLDYPKWHSVVLGNHDKEKQLHLYQRSFLWVAGRPTTWRTNTIVSEDWAFGRPYRVLLSHDPQLDLQGCDLNLYGHHHNNMLRCPERFPREEWAWLLDSKQHINVSCELLDYTPMSLEQLLQINA